MDEQRESPMVPIDRAEVRRCRQLLGQSQAQLAESARISASYISLIESGQRPTVSPGTFARICDALGIEDRERLLAEPLGSAQ